MAVFVDLTIDLNDNLTVNNIAALHEKGLVRTVFLFHHTGASGRNTAALSTAFQDLTDRRVHEWSLIKLSVGKAAVSAIYPGCPASEIQACGIGKQNTVRVILKFPVRYVPIVEFLGLS